MLGQADPARLECHRRELEKRLNAEDEENV
jgi:hypothetical protein